MSEARLAAIRELIAQCSPEEQASLFRELRARHTASDAMMLDFKVVMVSDCCAALSDDEHLATLETFIQQFGDVMTSSEVIARLK